MYVRGASTVGAVKAVGGLGDEGVEGDEGRVGGGGGCGVDGLGMHWNGWVFLGIFLFFWVFFGFSCGS